MEITTKNAKIINREIIISACQDLGFVKLEIDEADSYFRAFIDENTYIFGNSENSINEKECQGEIDFLKRQMKELETKIKLWEKIKEKISNAETANRKRN